MNQQKINISRLGIQQKSKMKDEKIQSKKIHLNWFDIKIHEIIEKLNIDNIRITDFSEAIRKQALNLESQINNTANKNDKSGFLNCLMKWQKCFQRQIENQKSGIIKCPYKGVLREINTNVCLWHRKKNDSECFKRKCPRLALKK